MWVVGSSQLWDDFLILSHDWLVYLSNGCPTEHLLVPTLEAQVMILNTTRCTFSL